MRVAVLGSGSGALAAAADMSRHGRDTALVDLDGDVPGALHGAGLIVVATPAPAHDIYANAVARHVSADQTVLFLGEGSGAIVARRVIDSPTVIAGANTPPWPARLAGADSAAVRRPRGGVLIAALPAIPSDTARVMELISDVWPCAAATDTVWNTVLTNYREIAELAAVSARCANLPAHTGDMLLLGEGAEPAVMTMIETVDSELLALRRALNSKERRGFQYFREAQGLAPNLGPGSSLATTHPSPATPDSAHVDVAHATDNAAYALVLASSLGSATGVPTPGIDGLVDGASVVLGRDFRAEGRTLAVLGLDGLDTTGLIGFARSGMFP